MEGVLRMVFPRPRPLEGVLCMACPGCASESGALEGRLSKVYLGGLRWKVCPGMCASGRRAVQDVPCKVCTVENVPWRVCFRSCALEGVMENVQGRVRTLQIMRPGKYALERVLSNLKKCALEGAP